VRLKSPDPDESIEDPPVQRANVAQKCMDIFARLIPFLYGTFAVAVLGMYVAGFVMEPLKDHMIWCIWSSSFACSLLGAWSVYKYGVIQDQIERIKCLNEQYGKELAELGAERKEFGNEMTNLRTGVEHLNNDAKVLDEKGREFAGLVEELKLIADDDEDVLDLVEKTNQIFNDMRAVVLENERAHLLSTFYGCAFLDSDNRMNQREYDSFLNRLTIKQRNYFEHQGSFAQFEEDGHIDLEKFQDILEVVLLNVDEMLREEFEFSMQ